jgi:hypothetical protein
MKRLNPEANKELTITAVNLSGKDIYKSIAPSIVYIPSEQITNVKGQLEPMVMHVCKPAKLVEALTNRKANSGREFDIPTIWKKYCGLIFVHTPTALFCSKCFTEFDGQLYKKLTIINAAGTLKL